jgi:hypothetical protein
MTPLKTNPAYPVAPQGGSWMVLADGTLLTQEQYQARQASKPAAPHQKTDQLAVAVATKEK